MSAAALRGTINADIRDSVPDWTPFESPKAPEGAPNVVYIVLDVGFSAMNCYGGPVETPNIDRIAATGERHAPHHVPCRFTGGVINRVVIDVSGTPYIDLE